MLLSNYKILVLDKPTADTGRIYPASEIQQAIASLNVVPGRRLMPVTRSDLTNMDPAIQTHTVSNLRIERGYLVGDIDVTCPSLVADIIGNRNTNAEPVFRIAALCQRDWIAGVEHCTNVTIYQINAVDQPPPVAVKVGNVTIS